MDIWTVVAAAGAGYVAQHCKKIISGRQDVPSSPTENDVLTLSESSTAKQQFLEKNLPLSRALTGKKENEDVCPDIDLSSHDTFVEEAFLRTYCRESLSHGNLAYSILHGGERFNDDIPQSNGDYSLQPSKEVCFSSGPATNTSALRTRRLRGKVLKPLTSLESCLMAQLYKEHAYTDNYGLDSVHSPLTPTNSPFVARRSQMSSRAGGDFLKLPVKIVEKQPTKNFSYSQGKPVCGLPHLPELMDLNLRKGAPRRTERLNDSITTANGKHQNFEGQRHGVLLFCLGISAGILSSFLANQREVDKLNQLLRQTKNLVDDLQEELEMKDSLTVKELAVVGDKSRDMHQDSLDYGRHSHSPEAKLDDSMLPNYGKCHDEESEVKSLSNIEAELEAELERLELTMNACSLEGKLCNLVELEPDILPDVAVGDFKVDAFSRQTGRQAYADQDGSGNSTPHPSNYAVSPTELSLRLHEVIESRLEARVKELEAALQNSQRKFQFAEYDNFESWRKVSISGAESSSNPASPVHENEPSCASHHVLINPPYEAQETSETNDLISKVNDSESDKPHGIISSSSGTSSAPYEQSSWQVQKGWMDNHVDPCRDEEAYNTMSCDISSSRESDDGGSQDEIEKLLIQHIVERARKQGSSVILNAQKALFWGNENGQ